MEDDIRIHVLHTGEVCVAPDLPFGGENCNAVKASGIFGKQSNRIWLPVSCYLIKSRSGLILFDCGWHRDMSPDGVFDRQAQIKSLGSWVLYKTNQGRVPSGQAVDEQLEALGYKSSDIDLVLLSHLDCDHANGLELVKDAKKILVSNDELVWADKHSLINMIRYNSKWWDKAKISGFEWNDTQGPVNKSFDVFGDGCFQMVNIPGHSNGLCALKIKNKQGKFVLLFSDGGYAEKSWREMIPSGIATDKVAQKKSLSWIREQSLDSNCIESLANHDANIAAHIIEL